MPNLLLFLLVFLVGVSASGAASTLVVLILLPVVCCVHWVSGFTTRLCVPVRDDSVGVTTGENALEHSDGRWWA